MKALAVLREGVSLSPGDPHSLATLGWACGRAGLRPEATDIASQIEEGYAGLAGDSVAMVFVGLGDHDKAFQFARLTVDLFRMPTVEPVHIRAECIREGRRIRVSHATATIDGREIARASERTYGIEPGSRGQCGGLS